jgi:hypothetical protein
MTGSPSDTDLRRVDDLSESLIESLVLPKSQDERSYEFGT